MEEFTFIVEGYGRVDVYATNMGEAFAKAEKEVGFTMAPGKWYLEKRTLHGRDHYPRGC